METPFDSWYNGVVGFHINSERIIDDLDMYGANAVDPNKLRKWMVVCWNNAIDAVEENIDTSDYTQLFALLREKT